MSYAMRVQEYGGAEALKAEDIEVGAPGPDEILIRQSAVGLNFIDTYHRTGLYPLELPFTPGMEGAGVVEETGDNVTELKPGDRVAYASLPVGAYAEKRVMPAERVVKIPDGITDEQAAASMLKGMTVEYLLNRAYKVQPGQIILFHAAAGGVGLIACQWAKALGVTIIGTAGNAEKAELAKAHGCDHVILHRQENIVERVMDITDGKGVAVVYDSIGRDTFEDSLDCLQGRGTMVSFGNASGPVEPFAPAMLSAKGSLTLTRPTLMDYTADPDEYQASAQALFTMIESGKVKIEINQRYDLKDAAQAHRDLESRKTTGSTILTIA